MYAEEYNLASEILETDDPVQQLKIGKRVRIRNTADWNKASIKCMMDGLTSKFEHNQDLCTFLKDTKDNTRVEASPYDKF
jgi:ribA/ribD-fused uncharacterized protein